MTEEKYYHTVRGKRKLCRLWLPPDSDAYWHMCGDPEDVAALSIPASGGVIELKVNDREHAHKIEAIMKELKARAKAGLLDRKYFDYYYTPSGDYNQGIDLLLLDLGVEPESKDPDTFIALRDYAEYVVRRAAGPRGGRPRRVRRRPEQNVRVKRYARRRYYVQEPRRGGHRVWVGSEKWPSEVGLSRLRRHRKRFHPRAFRASIRKGVATRKRNRRLEN